MSQLSKNTLSALLNEYQIQPENIYIGYSGGVDSHVLLHLCASAPEWQNKITAVHIHHNLQSQADSWAGHCATQAQHLGVKFCLLSVNATAQHGESPEEAARNARYGALKKLISHEGDILLIAQHQEDQLETVLLQLFRGTGLHGLAGMAACYHFAQGAILRPLLHSSKQAIIDYAHAQQLQWIEDPSNQSSQYDRNFLRLEVLPLLKKRWPSLDKTVSRSANHCLEAQRIISAVADELFEPIFNSNDNSLSICQLKTHKYTRQQLVIRHWFANLGLKMPSQAFVEQLLNEVILAKPSSTPLLIGQSHCIRRYRDRLYCLPQSNATPIGYLLWDKQFTTLRLNATYQLSCQLSYEGIAYKYWQNSVISIRERTGGERIRLPKRKNLHSLKKLFQEAGIPPWQREYIPLIYFDDELAAVGDKWISAQFYEQSDQLNCMQFHLHGF